MNTTRVDENYLQKLLDDLQSDHTTLFNSLKANMTAKEKTNLVERKVERHAKLLSDLMNKILNLKHLLEQIKTIKK